MSDDYSLSSDVSDFDFDRSTDESWRRFAERLAEVLSMMDAEADLTIGSLATPLEEAHHVRFEGGEQGSITAYADATGMGSDTSESLVEAGWAAVSDQPGIFRCIGTQEDADALADATSAALRDAFGVQHPALLAPDQLADILIPAPVEDARGGTLQQRVQPIEAATPEELDAALEFELAMFLGHTPLRDNSGDLALRVGSTMVFVRPAQDVQEVVVFASLVHDIEGRSRAMEVLSDLNTESRWVKFQLIRDRVYVSMSVPADPLIPAHLQRALSIVSLISDSIDEALAEKLRGRTTFGPDGEQDRRA